MQTLKNLRVQSALLLGGILLALFSAGAPRTAAAAICPQSAGCGGLTLSPASQTAYVQPGETYAFTYVLTNDAPYATTLQLTADSRHHWSTSLQPYMVYIKAFSSMDVLLKVAVPPATQGCICIIQDEVVISAGSLTRPPLGHLYLTNQLPVPALR